MFIWHNIKDQHNSYGHKMNILRNLSLVVFVVSLDLTIAATSDDLKNLLRDLFVNKTYNKYVRPSKNLDKITEITATFDLEYIESLDERQGLLTTTGMLNLQWKDELLVWNPSDYDYLHYFFIPTSHIWAPDIALWNGFSESKSGGVHSFQTRVFFDGTVDWMSFSAFKSKCHVNVIYFPFDSQSCNITFVARNTPYEVGFAKSENGFMIDDLESNGEWKVENTNVSITIDNMDVLISFSLTIKRKPVLVVFNMLLPILILSCLNLVTFAFPSQSGEKMGFSITVFLAFAVFLTIITGSLPDNSDSVSYIGIYLVMQLVQSSLIVVVSSFQIRIMFRSDDKTICCLLKALVRTVDFRGQYRCIKRQNKTNPTVINNFESEEIEKNYHMDENINAKTITWNDVSNSLDVYFFVFFGFCLILSTVILYIIVDKQI